ncbi:neuronal acetylcholine receptor subunit alpha-9-I-like, partial [Saccoglossus kowalevskii]|uniref:Neuronal acetylcholine receptor subunit alpha-9-I-like n=1 Tax=Saccoglossus kowalevskii TaxID=10224 RepID=A0ABM0GLC5_SACKO
HVSTSEYGAILVTDLMEKYPKYHVIPVKNESKPITVMHRLTPIQMLDMDEKNQIITIKCWLGQSWFDEYLQWDPRVYGGITQIHVNIREIWQPDIVLFGSIEKEFKRHYDTDAIVAYNGEVTALQPFTLEASCDIDVSYFPFDKQQCSLKFASWSYDSKFLDIEPDPMSNTDRFVMNGEWDLVHMPISRNLIHYVCCPDPFPDITYTIHIKRRSMYYVCNIIFPSFLACILVAVGFYLPSDSGERITLCVATILAQFLFLTIVTDFMPPNSEFIPKLQIYFFILIGLVIFSAVMTGCTLHMHYKGSHCEEVPLWLRNFAYNYLKKITCSDIQKKKTSNQNMSVNGVQPMNQANNSIDHCYEKQDGDNVKESHVRDTRLQEWRDIAKIIDRAYLIVFCFVLFAVLTGFLVALYVCASENNSEIP